MKGYQRIYQSMCKSEALSERMCYQSAHTAVKVCIKFVYERVCYIIPNRPWLKSDDGPPP